MDIPQIISITLGSFALGISLSGLLYMALTSPRKQKAEPKKREKKVDHQKLLKQLLLDAEPCDPTKPLKQQSWETTEEFAERVREKICRGTITLNAARLSIGLPPIKRDGDGINCATCKHYHGCFGGFNIGECEKCQSYNKWEPRA